MYIIFIILFIIAWSFIVLHFGISDLNEVLGGTEIYFFLLPLIAILSFRVKQIAPIIWAIILLFSSILLVNYFHTYAVLKQPYISSFLIFIYAVLMPNCLILIGCIMMLLCFFKQQQWNQYKHPDDKNVIVYFCGFLGLMMGLLMALTVPVLGCLWNPVVSNVATGYEIAMGITVLILLYFLLEIWKIKTTTINYYVKTYNRYPVNIKQANKYLIYSTLAISIISAFLEYLFRNHWIMWAESVLIFVINNFLLMKFWRVLFLPEQHQDIRPYNVYLPSIKSIKTIIMIFITLLVLIVCAFKS